MQYAAAVSLVLVVLAGCQSAPVPLPSRMSITLEELGIGVHELPRSYMLSDKKGGFLIGGIGSKAGRLSEQWSVDGTPLVDRIELTVAGERLTDEQLDSAMVYPHRVQKFFRDGTVEIISLLDGGALPGYHALLVQVWTSPGGDIALNVLPTQGIPAGRVMAGDGQTFWSVRWDKGQLILFAGSQGRAGNGGLVVPHEAAATFLLMFTRESRGTAPVAGLYSRSDVLARTRADRMVRLLNDSYIRTSDDRLNKAIYWTKLSLDALVVEASDTFAVAGVPWDGSLNCRDNAQSIAGIGLATGDYEKTASIIRSIARWQDTRADRPTYGRIADIVRDGSATFNGADVAPWFVREMYEHVGYANDTGLVKSIYPFIRRSMEGTRQYHTDTSNFLIHGDAETWMNATSGGKALSPRGNRAVELQLLWFFQQMISSYVASYVGDSANARGWMEGATTTAKNFSDSFTDTAHHLVYDHVTRSGEKVLELRPNAMLCLEMVNPEVLRQDMIKNIVQNLVTRNGVATLSHDDPRFRPYADPGISRSVAEAMYNGPVWTWLTGQLAYALTRYDRQDLSYQITQELVRRLLETDMAGTLPAMVEAWPRPGETEARAAGLRASLTGMSEFVRVLYQDYLGIRIDATSNQITLQPKLPDALTSVDFTVYAGRHPIHGAIIRGKETSRITLRAPDLLEGMRLRLLWMLDNGDAWRGSTVLPPDTLLTIVIGNDDILAYQGDTRIELTGKEKLQHFSQRSEFTGFDFADTRR